MQEWLHRWWISRAEHRRLSEYYINQIADLRARLSELEDQVQIEATYSLDHFAVAESDNVSPPSSNVVNVDFRKVR